MKKKVLLSSIGTIALCLCLIAGSTFALFTDSTNFNIAVTSGDVEIFASAEIAGVYSALVTDGEAGNVFLYDPEFGNNYVHDPKTVETDENGKGVKGTFTNGGYAEIDGANLVINRITPGDKVDVAINVENSSNVAIIYRYKIEAKDTNLAKGMVVTVDGNSYEALASWTSEWFALDAPGGVAEQISEEDAKTISVELPVYAGNEYQSEEGNKQSVEYTITVEAVQGNAGLENEENVVVYSTVNAINHALANGGEVVLKEDVNDVLTIGENADASLNLNGSSLNDNVVNKGAVEIVGGNISVDNSADAANNNSCGFQNNGGNATLTDIVMNAGDSNDYSNISHGGSVVYNNVEISANGGGIAATAGAQIEFNGGSVAITSTTTNPRYNIYAVDAGTKVVVNDGDFSFTSSTLKRSYVYAGEGTTVIINGGTFGAASTRQAAILADGTVIITGGTFGFDPSNWVGEGYVAVESGGVWTVTAQ